MRLWVDSRNAGCANVAAFNALWERHRDSTYRLVARLVGVHHSLADEIFQETWTDVIDTRRFAARNFRGFLRTIATNNAIDRLTGATLRLVQTAPLPDGPEDQSEPAVPRGSLTDPFECVQAHEAVTLLLDIAERMPPLQRIAWTLRYVDELTYDEIAEAMRCKVGTAKSRVRLAHDSLSKSLAAHGIDPADLGKEGR